MINLTVMHVKDIIKYLIKLGIILFIVMITIKLFSKKAENTMNSEEITNMSTKEKAESWQEIIDLGKMTFLLDTTIPKIKEVNKQISTEENLKHDEENVWEPLKIPLEMGLQMIGSVAKKEENTEQEKVIEEEKKEQEKLEQAKTGISTQVLENNVPDKYTNSFQGVQVKNGTSYALTEEMLKPDIEMNNKNVVLFHTHTCESYTATEKFNYQQTGNYRTTDFAYNIARVGEELSNQLKSYNFNVFHDTTYHDYPAYNGSYDRSLKTVENILQNNMKADVVIDLHRDAIADYSYAPTVKIGEEYAAQLMFVIGTDGGGLSHPNWNQNLKAAIKIQQKANELYPGLFKSIVLRNTRYNQHVAKGASIIEVGATGNTLEQCLVSMKYLAKVLSEVIK